MGSFACSSQIVDFFFRKTVCRQTAVDTSARRTAWTYDQSHRIAYLGVNMTKTNVQKKLEKLSKAIKDGDEALATKVICVMCFIVRVLAYVRDHVCARAYSCDTHSLILLLLFFFLFTPCDIGYLNMLFFFFSSY